MRNACINNGLDPALHLFLADDILDKTNFRDVESRIQNLMAANRIVLADSLGQLSGPASEAAPSCVFKRPRSQSLSGEERIEIHDDDNEDMEEEEEGGEEEEEEGEEEE